MNWGPGTILPGLIILVGIVMLMAGRGAIKVGEQIGFVIVGFLLLAALFALVINRTL